MTINESEEKIEELECRDCMASAGGCKHAFAFMMWLQRRSSEPAPTEVKCYWVKPILSNVGSSKKFVQAQEMVKRVQPKISISLDNHRFFKDLIQKGKEKKLDSQLSRHNYVLEERKPYALSIHQLLLKYIDNGGTDVDNFIQFSQKEMCQKLCDEAQNMTKDQSENLLWHELRYGRLTASKIYEASRCRTLDGSLKNNIVGTLKVFDNEYMKRGRDLEKKVRDQVQKYFNVKIDSCGFILLPDFPILGASPDGIGSDFVVEIKCPATDKGFKKFLPGGNIGLPYKAQINLQMFAAKKQKGLFCVAHPEFEKNSEVVIVSVKYDEEFTKEIINNAMEFWKKNVYPTLKKSLTNN